MHQVSGSIWIDAPLERVWDVLDDFGNIFRFAKGIKYSMCTSEAPTGLGATRHCDLDMMGASVEERITKYEPNQVMGFEVYAWRKLPFIKQMHGEVRLRPEGTGTRLEGDFHWQLTRNPFGHLANALVMKRMNRKQWMTFLASLGHVAETGEEIQKETELDLTRVSPTVGAA